MGRRFDFPTSYFYSMVKQALNLGVVQSIKEWYEISELCWEGRNEKRTRQFLRLTLLLQAVLTTPGAACPCLSFPFPQIYIPKSKGLQNLSIRSTLLAAASCCHAMSCSMYVFTSWGLSHYTLSTAVPVICKCDMSWVPCGAPASRQVCWCCMNPCGDLLP